MDNIDKVFSVVKIHCGKQKKLAELNSLEFIATAAKIPLGKLDVSLKQLQDMGLIKYSMASADPYIYLTALGKKQDHITSKQ